MIIIDTHCHLHYICKDKLSIDNLLNLCTTKNIKFLFNVGTKGNDAAEFIINNFEKLNDKIYHWKNLINLAYSTGYHPNEENIVNYEELLSISKNAMSIGEIGFDIGLNSTPLELQEKNFITQMEVAKHLNLPAIIHCRDAWQHFFLHTKNFIQEKYIIHCFTGDLEISKQLLKLNSLISFSGILTYKNANNIREALQYIPMDRIVVETDSPYLTPYNYRKTGVKENTPFYIDETIEKIAELKNYPIEKTKLILANNFKKFLNIESF